MFPRAGFHHTAKDQPSNCDCDSPLQSVIIIVDKLLVCNLFCFLYLPPLSPTLPMLPLQAISYCPRSTRDPLSNFKRFRPSVLATGSYWGNNALEAWLDDNYSVLRGWQRTHFCVCSHHIISLICKSSVIGIILAAYLYPQTSSSDASSYTAAMDNTPSSSTPPTRGLYLGKLI